MIADDGEVQKFAYSNQGLLLKKVGVPSPYLELGFQLRSIASPPTILESGMGRARPSSAVCMETSSLNPEILKVVDPNPRSLQQSPSPACCFYRAHVREVYWTGCGRGCDCDCCRCITEAMGPKPSSIPSWTGGVPRYRERV